MSTKKLTKRAKSPEAAKGIDARNGGANHERDEAVSLKLHHSLALLEILLLHFLSQPDEMQRVFGGRRHTEVGVLYAMQEFIESAKATIDGEAVVHG